MGISMVGSRPTTHHINTATASATILRAKFLTTYLRKKLRSEASMALSLRSIGQVLIVAWALALDHGPVGRQFVVRHDGWQGRRRHIPPQHFAQPFAQVLH